MPDAPRPTAVVYVDGHNLYKVRLKSSPELRWLNLLQMVEIMFVDYEIRLIHYFSAPLLARYAAADKMVNRQKTYFRALATLNPKIKIHLGHFRADSRLLPISPLTLNSDGIDYQRTGVVKFEEKGSDVHLGARLVADSASKKFDVGIVLSNDSDLAPAVNIAIAEFGANLLLLLPQSDVKRGSNQLRRSGFKKILALDQCAIEQSQFDQELRDSKGAFHRPKKWA